MTNTLPTFTVYFTGNVIDNTPIDLARAKFMQKFNISDEQMRGLIEHSANEPFPIKRSVPHEEAKKWEKHVTWCGFQCKVSPDNIDMMLSSSVFDDDSNTGKGLTVERWITCPQCFLRQDAENRYCDQCNAQLNY